MSRKDMWATWDQRKRTTVAFKLTPRNCGRQMATDLGACTTPFNNGVKLQPLRAGCPRASGSQRQPGGGCAQLSGVGKCRLTQVVSAQGYVVLRNFVTKVLAK